MGYVATSADDSRTSDVGTEKMHSRRLNDADEMTKSGRESSQSNELDVCNDDVFCDDRCERATAKRCRSKTESESDDEEDCCADAEDWPTIRLRLIGLSRFACDVAEFSSASYDEADCADFRLKRVLGSGGFGRVYFGESSSSLLVTENEFDAVGHGAVRRRRCVRFRPVAIKLLANKSASSTGSRGLAPSTIGTLRSEANAIGLDHPNVVRVLSAGWTVGTTAADVAERTKSVIRKWSAGAVDQLLQVTSLGFATAAVVMEFAGGRNLQWIIDDASETIEYQRRVRYLSIRDCIAPSKNDNLFLFIVRRLVK
jgi:serine/threonine protein kinase